jgi:tRNA pseudouridine55 synthase
MSSGFLVVDKPAGITSHDAVAKMRRALGTRRVGHAGTLDPMATGVLVIGVNYATRLLRYVESTTKQYEGLVTFGTRTNSLDATGEVTESKDASFLTADMINQALAEFRGEIQQIPPMVSAIKIGGEKLHVKARRGEVVDRPARTVTIHRLECNSFDGVTARILVECSAGTYIRTLADDLGIALGTVAHLSGLKRTAVGNSTLENALPLDQVTPEALCGVVDTLSHLPKREIDQEESEHIRNGRRIKPAGISGPYLAIYQNQLIAVLRDFDEVAKIEVGLPEPLG